MKKILILGAGNAQIDAIRYCKEKGYRVYGCSYTNTERGIKLLDDFKQVDIRNVDGVMEYAKEIEADIIYSIGSDIAMPTVCKVSELLNKPQFISYETANICQNKNMLRDFLGKDFIGNTTYISVSTLEEAMTFDIFPCIMKPVDSQGQRGVFKINSKEEIEEFFNKSIEFSNTNKLILEKYINGPEISVNAFVDNSELTYCLVSDRVVFDELPGGIIKEHIMPTKFVSEEIIEKVKDLVKRTIKKLNINNGPVYFQIKLDVDNPILIEVTPRLDGCHMWNLIKNYCGVDLLAASFEKLLFNKNTEFKESYKDGIYRLKFMCEKPQELFDRCKYNIDNNIYCEWYYEDNDIVKPMNRYMEKCGYIIEVI